MSRMLTAEPLYMPKNPSALFVLRKQSNLTKNRPPISMNNNNKTNKTCKRRVSCVFACIATGPWGPQIKYYISAWSSNTRTWGRDIATDINNIYSHRVIHALSVGADLLILQARLYQVQWEHAWHTDDAGDSSVHDFRHQPILEHRRKSNNLLSQLVI